MATNLDFTRIAAARQAAGFTTPFQLIVENSNETRNTGFTANATFLVLTIERHDDPACVELADGS
jgi:hypothetical protein